MDKKPLPEPAGTNQDIFIDGKMRNADVFTMRENNDTVHYAYIRKPNTDFGITASIRRLDL